VRSDPRTSYCARGRVVEGSEAPVIWFTCRAPPIKGSLVRTVGDNGDGWRGEDPLIDRARTAAPQIVASLNKHWINTNDR
jgi:hypothetical protein